MKRYKIGQIVEYSGYMWKVHSIIWIKDYKGKVKKVRLISVEASIENSWENISPYFLHCEININKLK